MAYQKRSSMGLRPAQSTETNTSTQEVRHKRTVRTDDVQVVTSGFAGKFLPVAMIPLLREDRAMSSTLSLNFQMAETADMLLNPVRVQASAWLVPKMAFERFQHGGFGAINRAYNGQMEIDDTVIPWFETYDPGRRDLEIFHKLGLHLSDTQVVNKDYIEAYNCVWNHIAKNMSKDIPLRVYDDDTVAPAFWEHTQMRHVKATFDDAMMEGQIPISFVGGTQMLPVTGTVDHIGVTGIQRFGETSGDDGAVSGSTPSAERLSMGLPGGNGINFNSEDGAIYSNGTIDFAGEDVFAELEQQAIQISLANIDLARETAAWARMRTRYQALGEEWMMDQLLRGIAMPEEGMKQPILLDRQSVPFGMIQRYATDGDSLQQSATNGQTGLSLRLRTPPVNSGGVIMVAAQILPEMTFERQRDYYFAATEVSHLPDRTADELDPQPVVEVYNQEVDELHGTPTDLFGYAPLNHQWIRNKPKIGGRYYRDNPQGPYDEDRNRIWDTTTVDPKLGEDFYLSTNINHDVFVSNTEEPFEIWASGRVAIEGLTFFGPQLRESTGDYQAVLDQVNVDRIEPQTLEEPTSKE